MIGALNAISTETDYIYEMKDVITKMSRDIDIIGRFTDIIYDRFPKTIKKLSYDHTNEFLLIVDKSERDLSYVLHDIFAEFIVDLYSDSETNAIVNKYDTNEVFLKLAHDRMLWRTASNSISVFSIGSVGEGNGYSIRLHN